MIRLFDGKIKGEDCRGVGLINGTEKMKKIRAYPSDPCNPCSVT